MSAAAHLAWLLRRFGFERTGVDPWAHGKNRHYYRRGPWVVSVIAGQGPYHVHREGPRGRRAWYVICSRDTPARTVMAIMDEIL